MSQNYNYPSSSSVTLTGTPNGAAIPSTSILVAGENSSGNQTPLQQDASGNLLVSLAAQPLSPLTTKDVSDGTIGLAIPSTAIAVGARTAAGNLASLLVNGSNFLQIDIASQSVSQLNTNLNSVGNTTLTLGSKPSIGSIPVVIASDQAALPLPTGASTSALQTSGNTSLSSIASSNSTIQTNAASIDTKTPTLGQALAAASVPVVLTAAQLTTLTPLTSITVTQTTGTNLHTVVDSSALPTGASTSALQTTLNAQIPSTLGQKTSTASLAVVLASDQSPVSVKAQAATPTPLTVTQSALSVGTTAVRLTVSGSAPAGTRVVLVATPDIADLGKFYIGSSTVTTTGATRGIQIVAGQTFIANNDAGDYWIISDTAAQTVEIMEQA